jgi:pyruvate,water dikinase
MESASTIRERAGQKRDAQLEAWCTACDNPAAVADLRRELRFARHVYTVLELHNHYIDQMANGQLHHAVMAAARWLAAEGILAQIDDVYWLTFPEILTALREGRDFAAQIATRKAEFAVWETYTAPPILGLPDAHLPERPPLVDAVTPEIELPPNVIAGQGASPGQFRGVARVVTDYHTDLTDIVPGTVLVAPNVGPRWTPLFPVLGALVLDHGGLGQHAAATAREYGLAAVTDTRTGTQRIPDGAQVLVDGTAGRVTIGG